MRWTSEKNMTTSYIDDIKDKWRRLLIDSELAKKYGMIQMITGFGHSSPNPIVERILPSLLYIRLGAFLDETFEEYITENNLEMSKSYKRDLNGMINFLNDQGLLNDAPKLHALRIKRNDLAHENGHFCKWSELEDGITIADIELQHLGLAKTRPKFEFYAERTPRWPPEPGYIMTFDFWYGLHENGKTIAKVSWVENVCEE